MRHISEDTDYQLLYTQKVEETEALHFKVSRLEQQLSQLKKMIYGSRQETTINCKQWVELISGVNTFSFGK